MNEAAIHMEFLLLCDIAIQMFLLSDLTLSPTLLQTTKPTLSSATDYYIFTL